MKHLKYSLLTTSFLMIGLCSCINEYLANCPPQHNILLEFSYGGDNNDLSMFAKKIDQVDLFVFDKEGNLLKDHTQRITKGQLDEFQGATLTLDPGNYTVICWANLLSHTEVTDTAELTTGRLHHPHFLTGDKIDTNDPLYFGEYELEVPEKGVTSGMIPFKGSHIKMEVYVKNIGRREDKSTYPVIEMHHVMPQKKMEDFGAAPSETTYYPATSYNKKHDRMQASFNVFQFGHDATIDIVDPQTEKSWTMRNIHEFIQQQAIDLTKNEVTISIEIEITSLGLKVTAPAWTIHDITI